MGQHGGRRYCRCGTRLAADNCANLCAACQSRSSATLATPPQVPPEFWQTDRMRDALAAWHMGQVIQAYRTHPWHGRPLPQGTVAAWVGLTQTQLSRIENGQPPQDLAKLIQWARVLRVPAQRLWFKLPASAMPDKATVAERERVAPPTDGHDVNRRELLYLMSLAGSLLAVPPATALDVERLAATSDRGQLGSATLDEYTRLNSYLWQVFAQSSVKQQALPLVRRHLAVLTGHLQRPQPTEAHRRLCELAGDVFQLCGEICFDSNRYTQAAQCYALAASASKEAEALDLWACAMTRHAFIGVYERRFDQAAPLLDGAASLARRGDATLPTRHWVSAVKAQTFAGRGEFDGCQRALETAGQVTELVSPSGTGWLRFTGSRLAEERGSCFVELGRPELAESALNEALECGLSVRRRGGVLTDLATVGVQRGDAEQAVLYASAAVDAARQTGSSGYVGRKLAILKPQLRPLLADKHVCHLDRQIADLSTN
jgi:transcriptional regulator with XRE-family HTH domain